MAEKITGRALRLQELITIATDGLALARMVIENLCLTPSNPDGWTRRASTVEMNEIVNASCELIKKAGQE